MAKSYSVKNKNQITDHGFDKVQGIVKILSAAEATMKRRWMVSSVRDILRKEGKIT